jgi:5-methylcytosine-specific restriction protein A
MTDDACKKAPRNPPWTRDELILALDLHVKYKGNPPGKASDQITDLSSLLNQTVDSPKVADYRNPNGVYMKLMNFRRFDPVYQQQGKKGLTRGNKLEEEVWNSLSDDPARLSGIAGAIQANIERVTVPLVELDELDIEEAEEGHVLTRAHLVRERSRKLVEAKKVSVLRSTGALACEACGFDFRARYGNGELGSLRFIMVCPYIYSSRAPRLSSVISIFSVPTAIA